MIYFLEHNTFWSDIMYENWNRIPVLEIYIVP